MRVLLDELDTKILNYLLKNEEFNAAKMAKLFRVTPQTIYIRIKKMKKAGIIKGLFPRIDPSLCGFNIGSVLMIKLKDNRDVSEFIKKFEKEKYTTIVYGLVGLYDILLVLRYNNRNKLNKFVEKIRKNKKVDYADLFYIEHVALERFAPYPLN